jgi:RNA-splicing ligase RtcB
MSRTAAAGKRNRKTGEIKKKGKISLNDFQNSMSGIYSKDVNTNHLDEAPQAYKDIDDVMNNQSDLVDIKVKLYPIFSMKG